ncbi:hypothetical protein [Blastopirellula marina]|uniref:Carboxypeptidase regulatory-like domain-containing protein n=1 Tax=Blastopirellula marina DSM 3645 TaxID=314230 RepID=A3ZQZ9_9BACT|nr:hypothetical protein [Blastopirellula marina]EAQ81092.1 hypothetical protein DSM3645_21012 [Blastopirellula marina DSM 3645]
MARYGLLLLFSFLLTAVGCSPDGPPIAEVAGQVLLDGKPLPEAEVTFQPVSGRPSVGTTDPDGRFEVHYSATRKGALVGDHSVRISTYQAPHPIGPNGEMSSLKKEVVPHRYNRDTELTQTVESWGNNFVFELQSK